MATYASITDITAIYGALTSDEVTKAGRLLEFASAEVRQLPLRVDARLAEGTLDPDVVASVVTAMVVRVLQNPLGRRQGSQSIDDFATSWTVDQALSSGALYLSDTELMKLQPAAQSLGVGTIRLGSWL